MIKNLLSWVILLVVLAGCKDAAELDPAMMGYQYYPLEVGNYRIYYVTKVKTQFDKQDTTRYFMREVVKSSFEDQTGEVNYRIERSSRPDTRSQWIADSVFVVSKSLTNVMLLANNARYVKLIFPVKTGKTWIADAYNENGDFGSEDSGLEKEPYTYAAVGEAFTFDDPDLIYNNTALQFDTTATIVQGIPHYERDEPILTHLDDRKEVYAVGVGLIYRKYLKAMLCVQEPNCSSYIRDGNERHEVLIDYGKL